MSFSRGISVASILVAAAALVAQPVARKESLKAKLLRIAGLTAAPSQMRAPGDEVEPGNIWIATVDQQASRALTRDGGYRSPIFDSDGNIYALKGEAIVRIAADGDQARSVQKAAGAAKLVGFDGTSSDELVVLLETPVAGSPLAAISVKSGRVTPLPYDAQSEEETRMVAQIQGQSRVYGQTVVYTKTEIKSGMFRPVEWTDVYIRRGVAGPLNVSACDGVNCVQPALSPDGHKVVFVKTGD